MHDRIRFWIGVIHLLNSKNSIGFLLPFSIQEPEHKNHGLSSFAILLMCVSLSTLTAKDLQGLLDEMSLAELKERLRIDRTLVVVQWIGASALELPLYQEAPSIRQVESQREKELDMKRERRNHNCKTVTLTSTPDKSDKTVKRGGTSNSFLMDELSLD